MQSFRGILEYLNNNMNAYTKNSYSNTKSKYLHRFFQTISNNPKSSIIESILEM